MRGRRILCDIKCMHFDETVEYVFFSCYEVRNKWYSDYDKFPVNSDGPVINA